MAMGNRGDRLASRTSVLFVCGYSAIYGGNFIPSLMRLESSIVSRGYNVIYLFPEKARERHWYQELQRLKKTVETGEIYGSKINFMRKLQHLIKKYNVGIIHSHFCPILTLEVFALFNRKVRLYVHLHSDFTGGKTDVKTRMKNRLIYRIFASRRVRFFSVSNALVKYNSHKITWIPNGLALDRVFERSKCGDKEIRKKNRIEDSTVFCEMFGWTPWIKGVDIAVEAIKRLREKCGLDIKLGIVCGEEMSTETMPHWIEEHTSCSGFEEYLVYLPPIEDVFAYHEAADFLISASRSEGFSYAILEMFSIGKGCIMSDIPGVSWATGFEGAYVFPSGDVEGCARALMSAIACREMRYDETARRIKEDYSIDSWVHSIIMGYGI